MDCYLCRHCKTITNFPISGLCEESPSGKHTWVQGEEIEDHIQMIWERTGSDLSNVAG